jgi:hypothetical protein
VTCCGHCRDAEGFFGARTARKDLRRYRRKGPLASTRLLVVRLAGQGVEGATLLDVGGGVGAVQHELFAAGLRSAVQVDASTAYLEASRQEAERRGHEARVEYLYGDFVELAPGVAGADLVTLDRVICCYPELEPLLEASLAKAGRGLGLVYPRERRGTGVAFFLVNLWLRIRRSAFRVYLHPVRDVEALARRRGFRRVAEGRTFLWRVEVYLREGGEADGGSGAKHVAP